MKEAAGLCTATLDNSAVDTLGDSMPETAPFASAPNNRFSVKSNGILVLGMHRSGTSAMTRVLNLLGCALPAEIVGPGDGNELGHWESLSAVAVNDEILASAGSSWEDWGPLNADWRESGLRTVLVQQVVGVVAEHAALGPLFVVKDPRLCRVADLWLDAMDDVGVEPHIILMIRNPTEVSASLENRDLMVAGYGHLLWLRHALDSEYLSRGRRRVVCRYDQLMRDWHGVIDHVKAGLDVVLPRNSPAVHAKIEKFLSAPQRHHKTDTADVVRNTALSEWLRRSFAIFLKWSENGEDKSDHAELDTIRNEFNRSYSTFARLLLSTEAAGDAGSGSVLKRQLNERQAEAERAAEAAQVTVQAAAEERASLAVREAELLARIDADHAMAQELRSEIERLRAETERLNARTSEAELTRIQSALQEQERQNAEMNGRAAAVENTLVQRQEELAQLWEQLRAAERASGASQAHAEQDRQRRIEAEQRLDALVSEIAELRYALAAQERAIETATSAQRAAEREIKAGNDERRTLLTRIDRSETSARTADLARVATEEKLAASTNEIAQLAARIADQERHIALSEGNSEWLRNVVHLSSRFPKWWAVMPSAWRRVSEYKRFHRAGLFDAAVYLQNNPDVAQARMDPLRHYLTHGMSEGRPRPTEKNILPSASDGEPFFAVEPQSRLAEYRVERTASIESGQHWLVFVAYSADGALSRCQQYQIATFADAGYKVALIVNTDRLHDFIPIDSKAADIVIIRENIGYDFGAWRHAVEVLGGLSAAESVSFTNDSILPVPEAAAAISKIRNRVEIAVGDVVFLTRNMEVRPHCQSYFFTLKRRALIGAGLRIIEATPYHRNKDRLIHEVEVHLSDRMAEAALEVDTLFDLNVMKNPTIHHWQELLDRGFPFVKIQLVTAGILSADDKKLVKRLGPSLVKILREHVAFRSKNNGMAQSGLNNTKRNLLAAKRPLNASTNLDALFIDGTNGTSSTPYRVFRIANGLADEGWKVRCVKGEDLLSLMQEDLRPRFAVFHRAPYWSPFTDFVDQLRARGAIIVYDIDDLVFDESVIPYIDGYRMLPKNAKQGFLDGLRAYRSFIQNADMCTSTTNFLVDEIRKLGAPTYRVRNAISIENITTFEDIGYHRKGRPSPFVVGYYSGTKTHQADFAVAAPALIQFMHENPDVVFRIVGDFDLNDWPELANWQHIHRAGDMPRTIRVGLMPHDAMIRDQFSCDLIIAPLEVGNPFCEAKSELKFFEASLAQAPVIASNTRTFAEASDFGRLTELAVTTQDWLNAFRTIYENYNVALNRARFAYDHVRFSYSQRFAANEALDAYESFEAKLSGSSLIKTGEDAVALTDIAVILPDVSGPSGGHRKIFTVCSALNNAGYSVKLYFYSVRSTKVIKRDIEKYFGIMNLQVACFSGDIDRHKVVICTQWKTAYDFRNFDFSGKVIYFVQDFEPMFHEVGSNYMRALVSYRLDYQIICYGKWVSAQLADSLKISTTAIPFTLDHCNYHPSNSEGDRDIDILVFARPSQDRRCLDLIVEGLVALKQQMPDVRIGFFGEDEYPDYGFAFVNLGSFSDLSQLAALYRRAKVGICYSPTNPSQLGYEMIACGACLIDVQVKFAELNFGGDDFVSYCDGTPEGMRDTCIALLTNPEERARRQSLGYSFVKAMPDDEELGRAFVVAAGLASTSKD